MLSYTRRFLLALFLVLLALLGSSADAPRSDPTAKQIAQWIEQLGDNNFKVRENATQKLWQAGSVAEFALEKARHNDDPEVSRRARDLLDKFHWGIYADTPADIVALIRAYRSSEVNQRLEILQKLLDGDEAGLRAVLKIAAAEKDVNLRNALGELVARKLPPAFFLAATEGKYEPFERLLEFGHTGKFIGCNQYAAYWLLRGKLAERIAHFRARMTVHPDDDWTAQTLAYLHRANGDLVEARKAAENSGRLDLLEGILYELGDWKALAERPDRTATDTVSEKGTYHISGAENPAEKWAYRAAVARLAGKQKYFDNAVRELRKFAEDREDHDSRAFLAAKGLLLNDRPTEGLELLRTVPDRRELLFDVLCARLDFAAAMDLAVKTVPNDKEIPSLDMARARLLCLLGEKEGGVLFDRYAERIKDGIDPDCVEKLLAEEMRAGLKDRAFAHAAKALSVAPPKDQRNLDQEARAGLYVAKLFPYQAKTAKVWWTVLRRQFKDESPEGVINRLRRLMEGKIAATDIKAWITADQGYREPIPSNNYPAAEMTAWRQALAEGALLAGLDDLARSELERTVRSLGGPRDALLRLGDLLAAKKQWMQAAQRYQQTWKKGLEMESERANGMRIRAIHGRGPYDPLPLYLAGDALVRAGREEEGKKLIEQAHWIPFADAETRDTFVRALIERGHKDAARRANELLARTSEPNTFYWGRAMYRRGEAALQRKDSRRAAEEFEKSMLRCLDSRTIFVSNHKYSEEPAKIHQLRARALLAAGKINEALKHAELAFADSPGYVDLPIALVPELERRGHKKEATDLFNRYYSTYEKICRAYPRYAWAHNSLAWLSACCRRDLDAALQRAQKAVELVPTHAAYLDTLAEVHFQRGDKTKAVALQKRVVEMDPRRAYYRKQLKRLEAGDPAAELPPENED